MKVMVYGHLKQRCGSSSLEIKLGGEMPLLDALRLLPDELKQLVLSKDGSVNPGILVLVNDVDARSVYGFNIKVSDSDRIALVPAIHGG